MQTSEAIDKIAPAFVKAQAACNGAKKSSNNPHFKSKYADLSAVWGACEEALEANALAVVQGLGEVIDGKLHIETMLLHSSGQWVKSLASIPLPKSDPQGYGSASTYARRYTLAAMMGIVQEDDDGNAASKPANDPAPSERALKRNTVTAPKEETWTYNTGPHKTKTAFEAAVKKLVHEIHGAGDLDMLEGVLAVPEYKQTIEQCKADRPDWYNGWEGMNPQFKPLGDLIASKRQELALNDSIPDFIHEQADRVAAG